MPLLGRRGSGGLSTGTTISDPARSGQDRFGHLLAAGDYNGDLNADLVIASTSNELDVVRGPFTRTGATGSGRYTVSTALLPVKGPDVLNLTAGDANHDHRDDLIVDGYARDDSGEFNYNSNYLLAGSSSGLTTTGSRKLPQGVNSAMGDVNGDGYKDLAFGITGLAGTDGGGITKGGGIQIVYGTASGPTGPSSIISQDLLGIPGSAESGDYFGYQISFGDINGDGKDDLVVGAPGENLNGVVDAGSVTVLYAEESDTGFALSGNQFLEQQTPGVPGVGEEGDDFGGEVFLSDVDGDGDGDVDLTAAAPGENAGNGFAAAFLSDGTRIGTAGRGIGLTAAGISSSGTPHFGHDIAG